MTDHDLCIITAETREEDRKLLIFNELKSEKEKGHRTTRNLDKVTAFLIIDPCAFVPLCQGNDPSTTCCKLLYLIIPSPRYSNHQSTSLAQVLKSLVAAESSGSCPR